MAHRAALSLIQGATLVQEEHLTETLHGEERVALIRQHLSLPGEPPLAVERTVAEAGAHKAPVILVHGFAQNRYSWHIHAKDRPEQGRSLVAYLAQAGHEVLNLELRGHGRSRALGAGNARCFHEYVEDTVRLVDLLSTPPFLIGHSLGGAVGVGVATERPLAGLVHLAGVYTFASGNPTIRALARLSLALPMGLGSLRVSTGWTGALLGRLYAFTDVAGYGAPIAGWVPGSVERSLLEPRLALGFDWTSLEVWLQMCRWAGGEPLAYREAFQKVDQPLLVIVGDHDPLVGVADAEACFLESGSTHKQLLLFDNFHHQVHWGHLDLILGKKAPEEVWPRLRRWLAAPGEPC